MSTEQSRFRRALTGVPPEVAERLNESIRTEPAPGKPWWRKLLGG
jgi:hypothetical protein